MNTIDRIEAKLRSTFKLPVFITLTGLAAITCLPTTLSASADTSYWISPAEHQADISYSDTLPNAELEMTARVLDSPKILVNLPESEDELGLPFKVEILFATEEGAQIDIDSIRILYGFMKLDITDRIREHATITSEGIFASGAAFPAGKHKIRIEVSDTKSRKNFKVLKFRVNKTHQAQNASKALADAN